MKPELSNGQSHFWQWDTNQKIKVDGEAKELHYIGIDGAVEVGGTAGRDGWAAVPDELLQNSGTILGWAYLTDHTIERFTVGVSPRAKPPDYVYTPTEVKTWTELEQKIRELEESGVSADTIEAAVSKWMEENPIEVEETDPTVPEMLKKSFSVSWDTELAEEVGVITMTTSLLAFEMLIEVPGSTATAAIGIDIYNDNGRIDYAWLPNVIYTDTRWVRCFLRGSGGIYTFGATAAAETLVRNAIRYDSPNLITDKDLPVTKIELTAKNNGKFPAGTKISVRRIPNEQEES